MNGNALALSIAIPTYGREQVLLDTIASLLAQQPPAQELLVMDQTAQHEPATASQLVEWNEAALIRWIRLAAPSITQAMNAALLQAREPLVLFLDDDIRPDPGLLAAHVAAHGIARAATHAASGAPASHRLVAGRVVQPWQEGVDPREFDSASFASLQASQRDEFMGGNFSVDRRAALALGGFDENFVRVAYRFEADFARRWIASGHALAFEPTACIHHLKAAAGGTRSFGDHLATWRPDHAVGAYYFALRAKDFAEFIRRPLRSVSTRYHLQRPWRILPTIVAEIGGMLWAIALAARGPRFARAASAHIPP